MTLLNYSKILGCDFREDQKFFHDENLKFLPSLTDFEGCAKICEEEFHSCEHGWTFDMGQLKVTIYIFKFIIRFLTISVLLQYG